MRHEGNYDERKVYEAKDRSKISFTEIYGYWNILTAPYPRGLEDGNSGRRQETGIWLICIWMTDTSDL